MAIKRACIFHVACLVYFDDETNKVASVVPDQEELSRTRIYPALHGEKGVEFGKRVFATKEEIENWDSNQE
jgi:hypothetical protein